MDKHASCEPEYISVWQKALSALQAFGEPPQGHVVSMQARLPWKRKVLGYFASSLPHCVEHLDMRCAGGLKSYSSASKRPRNTLPGLVLSHPPGGSGLCLLAQLPNLRTLDVDVAMGTDIGELAALTALTSLNLRLRDMPATSGCAGRDEGGLPHLRLHAHSLAPLSALTQLKHLSIGVEGLEHILQDSKPMRDSVPPTSRRSTPASSALCSGGAAFQGGAEEVQCGPGGLAHRSGAGEAQNEAGGLAY
ncbi:hypothetical protein DUNSADRAFT_2763, partial [Dunaliella salina]